MQEHGSFAACGPSVKLFDLDTHECLRDLQRGGAPHVTCMYPYHGTSQVLVAYEDGCALLWEIVNAKFSLTLQHSSTAACTAVCVDSEGEVYHPAR